MGLQRHRERGISCQESFRPGGAFGIALHCRLEVVRIAGSKVTVAGHKSREFGCHAMSATTIQCCAAWVETRRRYIQNLACDRADRAAISSVLLPDG